MTQSKDLEQKSAQVPKGSPPGERADGPGDVRGPTIGMPAHQAWGMGLPEPTEGPAQAIEGHFGPPQAPVGSLAPMQEQCATSQPQRGRKQGQQKSIGQRHQQEHFAPRLPALKSQGFDLEFAFLKTETFLNFPAADVGEDDVPGLLA